MTPNDLYEFTLAIVSVLELAGAFGLILLGGVCFCWLIKKIDL